MTTKTNPLAAISAAHDALMADEMHRTAKELRDARAAVTNLLASMPDLMALYRIKWGNTDKDALAVYERVVAALAAFEEK